MAETGDDGLTQYMALLAGRPADFDGPSDGVRIAQDRDEIGAIERHVAAAYVAKGWLPGWARAGLAYRDPFLRLVRDAVVFPNGRRAIHHRVLSNSDPSGAAVLPVQGNAIVLIRHFRHPTRRWHWEIPRGAVEPGQQPEETARAEVSEEIGAVVEELIELGHLHGSTALISGSVSLFLGRIGPTGAPQVEEGISDIRSFPIDEIEAMIRASEITDSFTVGAFLHARLRGLV